MTEITRDSLLTLETYSKQRPEFRQKAMARKKLRKVFLGDHVVLQFEDELTLRYQIQEMLRVEKTFDEQGIQDELDAYNPLLPSGTNWKATQTIEYPDVEQRKRKLMELKGLERSTYVQIGDQPKVYAIADEDLPRETEEKTSAVHFLRFELTGEMINQAKAGKAIAMGIDLPAYTVHIGEISPEIHQSLVKDLT